MKTCVVCGVANEKARNRRYPKACPAHRDEVRRADSRASCARRRKADPSKDREQWARWYRENAERVKERNRQRRKADPSKGREQCARWYRENADKVRERNRQRRQERDAEQAALATAGESNPSAATATQTHKLKAGKG